MSGRPAWGCRCVRSRTTGRTPWIRPSSLAAQSSRATGVFRAAQRSLRSARFASTRLFRTSSAATVTRSPNAAADSPPAFSHTSTRCGGEPRTTNRRGMPQSPSTSTPVSDAKASKTDPQASLTTPGRSESISTSEGSSSSEDKANAGLASTAPATTADTPADGAPAGKKRRTKKGDRDAAKAVRRRRRPGFTDRKHRREIEKAVIRARLEDDEPGLSPEALEARVDEEYAKLLPKDDKVKNAYEETAPVSACPNRRNVFSFVEAKAIQDLDETRELLDRLRTNPYGRPTDASWRPYSCATSWRTAALSSTATGRSSRPQTSQQHGRMTSPDAKDHGATSPTSTAPCTPRCCGSTLRSRFASTPGR